MSPFARAVAALILVPLVALGGVLWAAWPTPAVALPDGPVTLAVVGPTVGAKDGFSIAQCPDGQVLRQGGFRGEADAAAQSAASSRGWMAQAKPGKTLAAWATCGPRHRP